MTPDWELAYSFRIEQPTVLLNAWQRMHWAKQRRYTRQLQEHIFAAIQGRRPEKALMAAWIHVERGNPPPMPDQDGLIGGLKPLLDCLICPRLRRSHGLGFIIDDAPQFLRRLTAEAVPAPRGQGYTQVSIYRPAEKPAHQRRAA